MSQTPLFNTTISDSAAATFEEWVAPVQDMMGNLPREIDQADNNITLTKVGLKVVLGGLTLVAAALIENAASNAMIARR